MKSKLDRLFILSLAIASTNVYATSSMGSVEVEKKNDTICFWLPPRGWFSDDDHWMLLEVSDQSTPRQSWKDPISYMWKIVGPKSNPLSIDREHCIAYGVTPMGASTLVAPQELLPRTSYSVFIRTDRTGGSAGSMRNSTDFCIVPDANGATKIMTNFTPEGREVLATICTKPAPPP